MTNPAHLWGPRNLDNFILTRNFRPLIGTGKKHGTSIRQLADRQLIKPPGRQPV